MKRTPIGVQYGGMKLFFLFLLATSAFAGDWQAVQRLPHDSKIKVTTRDGSRTRATFVSAAEEALVVRGNSGVRSIARTNIRKVRVADPGRRTRNGFIWTAVGAGAGAGAALALCPYCPNEGHGYTFMVSAVAVGAGLGALTFLHEPYRTIYESK